MKHADNNPFKETIAQIAETHKAKKIGKLDKPNQIVLPFWEEPKRAIPSFMFRCALFSAIQSSDRKIYTELTRLASLNDMHVSFQGQQLNQEDLDVFEQIMHMISRQKSITDGCQFSAYTLLKNLEKNNGGEQHKWLKKCIIRLCTAFIEVKYKGIEVFGTLLIGGERDTDTQHHVLNCNPRMRDLYDFGWTKTVWEERQQLRRKPLALWLSGWIASHTQINPMSVEVYKNITGSNNGKIADFSRHLSRALEDLKNMNIIKFSLIEGGIVYINKLPSNSQRRFLSGKAAKEKIKNMGTTREASVKKGEKIRTELHRIHKKYEQKTSDK